MEDQLIGPVRQLLTMRDLPYKGALKDSELEIITDAGLWISNGYIKAVGVYEALVRQVPATTEFVAVPANTVCLPAFVDCHTHIAFGGNRAQDFALRNAGSSYLEIAQAGGGIWSTVQHTRAASQQELTALTLHRVAKLVQQGITTVEVKSGYGLNVDEELKMLRAIQAANTQTAADLVPTCLAAHMCPKDFNGDPNAYLEYIGNELFPLLVKEKLTHRIDAFIERSAFTAEDMRPYFRRAKEMGFAITVHADQFTTSGSQLAVDFSAVSADHLEASTAVEIASLAQSNVMAVALPAASLGLGCAFAPARKLLDAGAGLAIATDWNPGSAPMGQLISSASILATMEKLSNAEVLAATTFRAAKALGFTDRGRLVAGQQADFVFYQTDHYQNITYLQGALQPSMVWKMGKLVFTL